MRMRHGHQAQPRILVADRDRIHALTLAAIMHRAGFHVQTAFTGEDAILQAESFLPDLFVSEPHLDRMTGIEAASVITAALPGCRVLFLSSGASFPDIAQSAPRTLVYSFTSKPIHPLDLLNTIAYLLSAEWSTDDTAWKAANHITPRSPWAERTSVTYGLDLEQTSDAALTAN